MTEKKPIYHGDSSTTKEDQAVSSTSFKDRFPYVETPPDKLLLIPVLQSGLMHDEPPVCLNFIHLPNGNLSLCNKPTNERCPCCMLPTCKAHQSILPDEHQWGKEDVIPMCSTCANLPKAQGYALHAFVAQQNERITPHE